MPAPTVRRVLIQKGPNGLGFSVKGGCEECLPLLVSRVEAGGGAVGLLQVGMEITAVNGISLEGLPHYAAVEVLRRTRSPVILFVKSETSAQGTLTRKFTAQPKTHHSQPDYQECPDSQRATTEYERAMSVVPSRRYNTDSTYVELYDLRTVKRVVKEILHLPKEDFARKLAWQFPPIALGKFHKWLLTKLQRFDCETPASTANFIFDAFSQSLYLARAIYDLVHLIRTLMAMERAAHCTEEPTTERNKLLPTEMHNPQVMAAFVAELSEIRSQLANAKEPSSSHTPDQNAEIRALRQQLTAYESKIASLTAGGTRSKDSDIGSFFKGNFKWLKNRTLTRKGSLNQGRDQTLPKNRQRVAQKEEQQLHVQSPARTVKPCDSDVTVQVAQESRDPRSKEDSPSTSHSEIVVRMGEAVQAHSLQVNSNDSMLLSPGPAPRDRVCSSDDDYVLMNGVPSPVGTLPRNSSPLNEDETVVRRNKDHKRASVTSSQSKASIESIKLKHKQIIMISDSPSPGGDCHTDYIQMPQMEGIRLGGSRDETEDYVESDVLPLLTERARRSLEAQYDPLAGPAASPPNTPRKMQHGHVNSAVEEVGDVSYLEEKVGLKKKGEESTIVGSDTVSTNTLNAEINVTEERQINATQVTEIGRDVDSILLDVATLHQMEKALTLEKSLTKPAPPRPAVFPKPVLPKSQTSPYAVHSMSLECDGSMVKAHEVPIYAKVDRVVSPPPPRIRPFSFGEASNSSYTSQNELSRHDVCAKGAGARKTSLTSNGSSVELKSDYSSDRLSSYNASHTTSTEHGDRYSRISSDLTPDDDRRLSVLSDNRSDPVFSPRPLDTLPRPLDPLSEPGSQTPPAKPPRSRTSTPNHEQQPEKTTDCLNQEVGADFFNRGKKAPKKATPFKKLMSFGKGGRKKRSSSSGSVESLCSTASPRPRQPDVRNPTRKLSTDSYSSRSHHYSACSSSDLVEGSRDYASSSSPRPSRHSSSRHSSSRHSTASSSYRGSVAISVMSGDGLLGSPVEEEARGTPSFPDPLHEGVQSAAVYDDRVQDLIRNLSREATTPNNDRFSLNSLSGNVTNFTDNRNNDDNFVRGYPVVSNMVSTPKRTSTVSSSVSDTGIAEEITPDNMACLAQFLPHTSPTNVIYPYSPPIFSPEASLPDLSRKQSKGFYDDLGINIDFDSIPVANDPVLDLTNETIIDLDCGVIRDPGQLKALLREVPPVKDPGQLKTLGLPTSPVKSPERLIDSNLNSKVQDELKISNECNRLVGEVERLTSPDLYRLRERQTPSPASFSEIDILLGNITAELDSFDI